MSKRLTPKQAKFVKGLAAGKSGTQAALEAYDTTDPNTAKVIASENLTKPNVRDAIENAMMKLNLTPERALKPIDDALKHDDLDMRLKGTDRWLKLIPKDKGDTNINLNFNQVSDELRNKYGI